MTSRQRRGYGLAMSPNDVAVTSGRLSLLTLPQPRQKTLRRRKFGQRMTLRQRNCVSLDVANVTYRSRALTVPQTDRKSTRLNSSH